MKILMYLFTGVGVFASGSAIKEMCNPLGYENNVNTVMQKDQYGNYQNLAYMDADNGLQVGPDDPRMSIITQVPINAFRPQPFSDFDERTLDSKWLFTGTGSSYYTLSDSNVTIQTGSTNNSTGELTMTNVPMHFVNGQKIYFYLSTVPNGNLELEFGIKKDDNNLIRFRRTEDDVAQPYISEVKSGGTTDSYPGIGTGDSVRRLFCIHITSEGTKFYIGTDMGELQLKSTHTAFLPAGKGYAYLKFKNRYPAPRSVSVDFVWLVRVR